MFFSILVREDTNQGGGCFFALFLFPLIRRIVEVYNNTQTQESDATPSGSNNPVLLNEL